MHLDLHKNQIGGLSKVACPKRFECFCSECVLIFQLDHKFCLNG